MPGPRFTEAKHIDLYRVVNATPGDCQAKVVVAGHTSSGLT